MIWHVVYVVWVLTALAVLLYIATMEVSRAWDRHGDRREMWHQVETLFDSPFDQDGPHA